MAILLTSISMDRIVIYLGLLAALVSVGMAAECYDCWHVSILGNYDDVCNTDSGLGGVDKETCSGSCYTKKYGVSKVFYVKRGCKESCQNETSLIEEVGADGNTVCCTGDLCNKDIISSAVPTKLSLPIFFISAALATLLTFKLK